ncbi:MAG: hypothetical protein QOK39_900 [Acidimicrobiaceae bacterium]|nr:hypothetical protein [Acidimicrobiaceae bacterium]
MISRKNLPHASVELGMNNPSTGGSNPTPGSPLRHMVVNIDRENIRGTGPTVVLLWPDIE